MHFVPIQALQPGMIVGRDIINKKTTAMIRKGIQLTERHVEYLVDHGYIGVYVSDLLTEDVEIADPISTKLFADSVDAVYEENIGKIVDSATRIVTEIVSQDEVNLDLLDLRSFDDYTYHHSVNVSVYSVAVGKKMGLSEQELSYLSQAAIFHDIGKMDIPEEILNKPDKLTDEEYEIIKEHSKKSYEKLAESVEISAKVKQAVLFHHENENGSGYPMHKMGSELSLITKIVHAVDVYDALTSKRPYKDPHSPVAAFEYLRDGCDILFDRKVVEAMQQVIPVYPPGMDVLLSDGRKGIVIGHTADPMRPIIKLIEEKVTLNLSESANSNIAITESGFMISDYSEEVEMLNESRNKPAKIKEKVLIVDGKMTSIMQTKATLGEEYQVFGALNGLEALGIIAKEGTPDLIIVDIEMQGMSGISFIKALRKKGNLEIPIIVMTATSDRKTIFECISAGAADYIVKPASPVYVKGRVEVALRKQHD